MEYSNNKSRNETKEHVYFLLSQTPLPRGEESAICQVFFLLVCQWHLHRYVFFGFVMFARVVWLFLFYLLALQMTGTQQRPPDSESNRTVLSRLCFAETWNMNMHNGGALDWQPSRSCIPHAPSPKYVLSLMNTTLLVSFIF